VQNEFFLKKIAEKFAQNKKVPYICTRNQERKFKVCKMPL